MKIQLVLLLLVSSVIFVNAGYKKRSECVFPFNYNGEVYDDCITDDAAAPWCSAVKNYNGMFFYCNNNEGDTQEKNGAFLQVQQKLLDNKKVLTGGFGNMIDKCETCEGRLLVMANALKQLQKILDDNDRQINFLLDVENKRTSDVLDANFKDISEHLNCPTGWYRLNGNECYHFGRNMNLEKARSYCKSKGGILTSIRNADENKKIMDKGRQIFSSNSAVSIGFTDQETEGTWVWDDASSSSYTNWRSGEPNNVGDEDCVMLALESGQWNDISCSGNSNPVCRGKILEVK